MKNNSLREIAKKLSEAKSILLFPHVNLDGDALGSCAALCKALRNEGKEAWILLEDDIPANLSFLDNGYCTWDMDIVKNQDISMCVDCGELSRFPNRTEKFQEASTTMCLDHHATTNFFCDYNYIDSNESASGQIVFQLLMEMGTAPDTEIGEAILTAIITDTGNFQYANTQKKSHTIVAELYDWGVDVNKVSVELYENVRLEQVMMKKLAMETLQIVGGGLGAILYVSQEMLEKSGATMDESESLSQDLRSISGVKYSAVIKEQDPQSVRVSLRAKREGNVLKIAQNLGGGGHLKAAGCTINAPLKEAVAMVENELTKAIEEFK